LAAEAAALCRAEVAFVFLREGDLFHFVAASGGRPEHWDYERLHPDPIDRGSIVGRVALAGKAVQITDITADPEYHSSAYTVGGNRTLAGVPIRSDGALIGAFGLGRAEVQPFSDAEIELVGLFADQAAVAIRLARLLGETHEALERETAVGSVLQSISRSTFDLQHVLQTVIDSATRLSHADEGNIVREGNGRFRMAAYTAGVPAEFRAIIDQLTFQPERGTITGRVLMERRPVQIVDIKADAEYQHPEAQRASGFRTVLAVPLMREGNPIGVLIVWRLVVQPFTDAEIGLLQTFADQAAIAIANAQLFETVERQRTELARFAPQVAGLLTSEEGEQLLAGHRREISAMFCDLRGFTAFAETAEPEELLSVIRSYHAAVGELSVEAGGTVEHFAGDGLMVFFNDPAPVADHQLAAVRTACAVRDRFNELAAAWHKRGYELGLGIGIASGYATLGRIGFEGRYDYGAMGIIVNLAARLSDAAEGGQILISQRHYAVVEEAVEATERPPVSLKGFGRPIPVWAVDSIRP
ncbi:MAG TPA: GAF domain-containing protein, partial [Candidatus Binatia bacterium]|nr:GAF domain-containing protein [Candidatus Binatia bacterium]